MTMMPGRKGIVPGSREDVANDRITAASDDLASHAPYLPPRHSSGWIGVDLDGTLAHYDRWHEDGRIGEPVPAMAERVRAWLADGRTVVIFTARLAREADRPEAVAAARERIAAWTLQHFGVALRATAEKDYRFTTIVDDRCVAIEANTGRVLGGEMP